MGAELFHTDGERQRDRHEELIVTFRNIANAPQMQMNKRYVTFEVLIAFIIKLTVKNSEDERGVFLPNTGDIKPICWQKIYSETRYYSSSYITPHSDEHLSLTLWKFKTEF